MKEDWIEIEIGKAGEVVSGGTPRTSIPNYWSEEIAWITPADLSGYNQKYISKGRKSISVDGLQKSSAKLMPAGSILFSSRAPIGYVAIAKNELCTNQGFKSLIPYDFVNNEFVYYYFKSIKQKAESKASGTTFKELSGKAFSALRIPIIPLPEQRAIVAKIEQLFSELDNGIDNLKKAQEQLKVYRQAVLKKAFEGELTKVWRAKQTDLPTADELLEQIKREREAYFQQQVEEWKPEVKAWESNEEKGKKPSKPRMSNELPELTEEELAALPVVPDGWKWVKFGNACVRIFDGTHFSPKNIAEGAYKYITAKNIKEGRIQLDNISYVTEKDHKEIYSRCDVTKGDVLYIKDGATTGKAAVNYLEEEFSLLSSVGVFRTFHHLIVPKYIEHYLNAQVTRNRMLSNVAGVAITRLTLVKLSNSALAITSPQEQHQIVQEIESRLSVCDKVEETIKESLERAEALRQSILKKAFEGMLLTEAELEACRKERDWEPAEKLLERIKAEKGKAGKGKKKEVLA